MLGTGLGTLREQYTFVIDEPTLQPLIIIMIIVNIYFCLTQAWISHEKGKLGGLRSLGYLDIEAL